MTRRSLTRGLGLAIAAIAVVAACRPAALPVTAQHAQWAQSQWPATTQGDLERGRSLFMAKCSGCHRPPAPSEHAPGDWPGEVAEMQERAHLSSDEVMLIERYIVTVASNQ